MAWKVPRRDGISFLLYGLMWAAQPTTWRREDDPQYADDPEFQRFTTDLSDKLFSLTSNISKLSNEVTKIGTRHETSRVKERIQDLQEETSEGFKEVGEGLKRVQAWPDLGVIGMKQHRRSTG